MNIGSSAYEDRFIFPLPKFIFNQVAQVELLSHCSRSKSWKVQKRTCKFRPFTLILPTNVKKQLTNVATIRKNAYICCHVSWERLATSRRAIMLWPASMSRRLTLFCPHKIIIKNKTICQSVLNVVVNWRKGKSSVWNAVDCNWKVYHP